MFKRFRPRRADEETRKNNRETFLYKHELIWPVFIVEGKGIREEITSMKGVFHYSIDQFLEESEKLIEIGLKSVLIFGVPEHKGIEQASSTGGIVQKAIKAVKKRSPGLEIITDVCLCSYTEDGQCHIGDNDSTCEVLSDIALSHAEAGADIVAPSDMMDGRVEYIKKRLTDKGFPDLPIMSDSAKYASNYYGPFRNAADCAPKSGDRKDYQMDPPNTDEAMEEISADIEEGASCVIIKPALSYLDIIYRARQKFNVPIIAYNVSGEYTALRLMVEHGFAGQEIIQESLISIKRAGAGRIITYFTPDILSGRIKI